VSYDLIIKTPQGILLSSEQSGELFDDFCKETNLHRLCEITYLADDPDSYDASLLEECFDSGEFERSEYVEFCRQSKLSLRMGGQQEHKAARMFLDSKWGQKLFSPGMPRTDNETRKAYHLIVEFARRHNLVVYDPQAGRNIDLANPGEFPPWWQPESKGPFCSIRNWFSKRNR